MIAQSGALTIFTGLQKLCHLILTYLESSENIHIIDVPRWRNKMAPFAIIVKKRMQLKYVHVWSSNQLH